MAIFIVIMAQMNSCSEVACIKNKGTLILDHKKENSFTHKLQVISFSHSYPKRTSLCNQNKPKEKNRNQKNLIS